MINTAEIACISKALLRRPPTMLLNFDLNDFNSRNNTSPNARARTMVRLRQAHMYLSKFKVDILIHVQLNQISDPGLLY